MKPKTRLHKLTACMLVFIMLASFVTWIPLTAHAASIAKEYNYKIKVKNGDVRYAGTDGDVFCVVKTHTNATLYEKIDSNANDFERNDCREYTVNLELQPWEIKEVGLKNNGKDGAYIAWFEWKHPNASAVRVNMNAWLEKQGNAVYERTYSVKGSVDRQIKSTGNFSSQFSGTKYVAPSVTSGQSDIKMEWNGKVSDQYFSEYNYFDYYGAENIKFEPYGKSYGFGGITDMDGLEGNSLAEVGQTNDFNSKLTLRTNKLLDYMNRNEIFKLTVDSTLNYNKNSDEYNGIAGSYVIYRTGFKLEGASVVTAAFVPKENPNYKDHRYFNSSPSYSSFTVKVPVKNMDNYNNSTIAASLVSNINNSKSDTKAKVYYDKVETGKFVTPKSVYNTGSDIYMICDVPANYPNNDSAGLTVVIENAKASYNKQTYTLYEKDNSTGNYSSYISTHKVDTKGLTHTIKDESDNVVSASKGFNTYKKEHKFKLEVDAGQKIFVDNNSGGRTENSFSYRLYTKGSNEEIELKKHNGQASSNVPHTGGTEYTIATSDKAEGEYRLVISTKDLADNLTETSLPVYLDTIAPRASYTAQEHAPVDGSKRNEYSFNLDDNSGTGRLNYVFVRDGKDVPDSSVTKPDSSGPEDTLYEKWGFINQKNSSAQTVVLSLAEGDYFKGRLYWYTVDEAGNDSRREGHSGTDKNGYYYTDIELSAVKAECDIVIDDITPGKPSYDIDFETNSLNTVKYRWISGSLTTPYNTYNSSSRPGSSSQKDLMGNNVTLSGKYILEYVVTTPDGAKNTYKREFVYDNTEPEIIIENTGSTIGDTANFSITAKDITNIKSIKYSVYTADGTKVIEDTELPAGLPVVSNEIMVAPEKTGAYKVKVVATDVNNQSSEVESTVFSIRNAAPKLSVNYYNWVQIDGIPVVNSQNYDLDLVVEEPVVSVGKFAENQVVRYRFSGDGVNYGEWMTIEDITRDESGGCFRAEHNVECPVPLNDGENRIYVQAVFADKNADAGKVRNEFIATNSDIVIIYDAKAPQYKLEIDDSEITNQNIKGTLSIVDDYSHAENIKFTNNIYGCTASERRNEDGGIAVEGFRVIDLEFSSNVDKSGSECFILTDDAGNEAKIQFEINCIDKYPPIFNHEYSTVIYSGERQDFNVSLTVDEAIEGNTRFALIEGDFTLAPNDSGDPNAEPPYIPSDEIDDSLFGPEPGDASYEINEAIKVVGKETLYDYGNGETQTRYDVMVSADEETPADTYEEWEELNNKGYVLVARSEDTAGNVRKEAVSYGMRLINRTAQITSSECRPEKAGSLSVLNMYMSVPVYLLPDGVDIPQAVSDLPDGRIDTSGNAEVVSFAENIVNRAGVYSTNVSMVVSSLGEKAVYFADDCGRVYKQTVTIKDLAQKDADGGEDNPLTAYVSFGNNPPVSTSLYEASSYGEDMSSWTELNIDDVKALDMNSGKCYFLVLEADNDTVGMSEEFISGDYYQSDFYFDYSNSVYVDGVGYTKLVYEVADNENTNKLVAVNVTYNNEGVDDETGYVAALKLQDATPPMAEVVYSTKGYTKEDVVVTVMASDPDLAASIDGTESIPGEDPTAGAEVQTKTFTDAQLAETAGIESIAFSEISPDEPWDLGALSYGEPIEASSAKLTFTSNGYAAAKIINKLGLVEYVAISVENINKDTFEKGTHYDVKYKYVKSNGDMAEITSDGYYKEVIAEVEILTEGYYRELELVGNAGETQKKLTSFDNSFTFNLKDRYGHTQDVHVFFERFDESGPVIDYKLMNTAKTNQPVGVEVKIADMLSEAESATLTGPDGSDIPLVFDRDVTDTASGAVTRIFKASVPASGYYKISAADIFGNTSYTGFAVTNIDTTVPVVVEKKATSVEPTRQTVGVKLYYSEPGVVITRAEVAGGTSLTEDDITINYNDSALRFSENGTVSVWFADEYGNVGSDVVSVGNINRTPPSLSPVTTLADDALSVDVSFVKNEDEKRELSDLYVMYGGTTPVITETDADGNITSERIADASEVTFTFVENGTYIFNIYDSIGNIQELPVEISSIDTKAPVITEVAWSYKYTDETGAEKVVNCKLTPGDEAGYNIVEDESHKGTNQDITATVTTDDPTRFAGSTGDFSLTNSITYDKDGWFNFDLVKRNNLMDRYGLGLYLIDKTPPVIEDVGDLIFFENPKAGTPYSKDLLTFRAYDERYGEVTDLTSAVKIDWGGFNPDDINANTFDKNKPYTITYTVKDKVGNETSVRRQITLVGLFDTMMRVNGKYPDSSGRVEVVGNAVELTLDNFGGTAYARYEKGIYTMGEMKNKGTVIKPEGGKFKLDKLSEGWYTFYVQTDLKDYFSVNVYVYNQ